MPEVVNLRQVRKQKARAEKERLADANRALHGRTKAEKIRAKVEAEKSAAFIEGHRLEPPARDGNA